MSEFSAIINIPRIVSGIRPEWNDGISPAYSARITGHSEEVSAPSARGILASGSPTTCPEPDESVSREVWCQNPATVSKSAAAAPRAPNFARCENTLALAQLPYREDLPHWSGILAGNCVMSPLSGIEVGSSKERVFGSIETNPAAVTR